MQFKSGSATVSVAPVAASRRLAWVRGEGRHLVSSCVARAP